jgi:DNA-binding response OmpR family regulator
MRVLVADDDRALTRMLETGLTAEMFAVDQAANGEEALELIVAIDYDLVVLDLVMPGIDGLSVLKQVRESSNPVPIILLSALDTVADKVRGLQNGADDYVVKPFFFAELVARINALLRRPQRVTDKVLVADLEVDCARRAVKRAGRPILLTTKEFDLLQYLVRKVNRPVTRNMLLQNVWDRDIGPTNVVEVYIGYLRTKIDDAAEVKLIRTIRGVGYMVALPEARELAA